VCVGVWGGGQGACVGEGVNDNGVEEPAKEGGDELGDDETLCKVCWQVKGGEMHPRLLLVPGTTSGASTGGTSNL
jgi:hypothetical protein